MSSPQLSASPALAWEERLWVSRTSPDLLPRSIAARHRGAYRAAVAPEIAALQPQLPGEMLAMAKDSFTAMTSKASAAAPCARDQDASAP